MAKLYFYYASMNAGKSTTLLQAAFNYKERGMETMLWTAALDDRSEHQAIESRIGLGADAHRFDAATDLWERVSAAHRVEPLACVLRGAERLHWLDVSAGTSLGEGLSCEAAMRRFHVRDAQGRLLSGGAAFARLWRALPGWRVAGWLFAWPPLSWLLELAYRAFLPLRPRLQRLVRRWWPEPETLA